MTLVAVVQARMRSERLPGKVLMEAGGRSLLQHLLGRLARAASLSGTIVATSTDPSDDAIAARCAAIGVPCHRGPLTDVAGRFAEVVDRFALEAFVRVSADSPLLDPAVVDRVAGAYEHGVVDLATNVDPRTFPRGQSVEVVNARAFRRALDLMEGPRDREHVTTVFYRHRDRFVLRNVRSDAELSTMSMAVDTAEDLVRLRAVLAATDSADGGGLAELVSLYRGQAVVRPS